MSTISVVVLSLNDGELLAVCLAALRRQTRQADEVLVVDNGSIDNTVEVALAAGARVVSEPERGIPSATAAGFDAATSDVLVRIDADSVAPPDWLEKLEAVFNAAAGPTVATGPGEFYGAGKIRSWFARRVFIGGYFWTMTLLMGHPPVFGSNFAMDALVWRAIRHRVHRHAQSVHDDVDISMQLEPWVSVVYDRSLVVGISARPINSPRGWVRRLVWIWNTVRINADRGSLRERRARWRRARRLRNTGDQSRSLA